MKISVFGLGYVGVVSAACLARDGHSIVGVDSQPSKVELVQLGKSPIVEKYVGELIGEAVENGRLRATADASEAVLNTELSLVCVGTPSGRNGSLDTGAIERVCREIGTAMKLKDRRHTVVIRSTILPGTMRGLVKTTLERASGLSAGADFGLANNPEFLRESTAVYDYDHPPKIVIGALDNDTAEIVAGLYKHIEAPLIVTSVEVTELVKYTDNAWHAVKVVFGNEIGNIAKASGVDGQEVMNIFCQDKKLNISPAYLMPGFAFGGSCLPKDVRAINYMGRELDLELPLLISLLPSNERQITRAFERIISYKNCRRISFMGISFKSGTDDLRESPQVKLVEQLIGKGFDLKIYDRNVHMARLSGANRDYILNVIPHISELLSDDLAAVLTHGDLVVIGNDAPEFKGIASMIRDNQVVYDLARIANAEEIGARYDGVNW